MRDLTGFVAALDRLRTDRGLSFRQLETNARAQGGWLARATANDVVKRGQLPTQQDPVDFITAWVRACGEDPESWLEDWRQLNDRPEDARVPRQLPPDVLGFTGRADALAALEAIATHEGGGPAVAVITGTAGAGKTALAIRWAHRNAERFPDGQLHIDLRGFSNDPPVEPEQALNLFLQALGVPNGEIPISLQAQVGLYRSLLAGRRVLLVLDNAADAGQVRPLLPAGPGSAVVVTSRHRMTGLVARDGARPVHLGELDPEAARDLVAELIGPERALAEPDALAEIVRLCAGLPLALRISAANLACQPHLSLAEHADLLGGGDRLGALEIEGDSETAVRAAFRLSYERLSPAARRMFRLLGLAPVADFSLHAAAALSGAAQGEAALAELVAAHLTEPAAGGRYGVHDLLRRYAAERAEAEDAPADRVEATDRLGRWYSAQVTGACKAVHPHLSRLGVTEPWPGLTPATFADAAAALRWLQAEHANIIALARHAAEYGPRPMAWHLADRMRGVWFVRRNMADLVAVSEAALHAALAEGYVLAQAMAHHSLGMAHWWAADYEASLVHIRRGLEHYRQMGNQVGACSLLNNLAMVYRETGRLTEAEAAIRESLLHEDPAQPYLVGLCSSTLSEVLVDAGKHEEGLQAAESACRTAEFLGDARILSDSLDAKGDALAELGRPVEALAAYEEALRYQEAIDYLRGQAETEAGMGEVWLGLGDPARAVHHVERALSLARETSHRLAEGRALLVLARVCARQGDLPRARALAQQAVDMHGRYGQAHAEAVARAVLKKF